jgi:hypothetical protein
VCAVAFVVSLSSLAFAEDIPLANGERWQASSRPEKISYIIGISNLMVLEYLYQEGAGQRPSDDQTIIQRLYHAAEGKTLDAMIAEVDQWYSDNPDKLQEPVLIVIWNEVVKEEM